MIASQAKLYISSFLSKKAFEISYPNAFFDKHLENTPNVNFGITHFLIFVLQ